MAGTQILIVEDEKLIRWSLRERLAEEGYACEAVASAEEGLEQLEDREFDILILDYKLPGMDGLEMLARVREHQSDILVILITAFDDVDLVVRAMRLGASDYIVKSHDMIERVLHVIEKAIRTRELHREVEALRPRETDRARERIIGKSERLLAALDLVKRVAATDATTILLLGESGTGKGIVARAIHERSARRGRPFLTVTCTALQETLLESELLGHERGAFTDAKKRKKGLFELADGGTIFLDEIGDISPTFQAKLLHFLEDKTFKRVGGTRDIIVDVRIIAATNRDLDTAVAEGAFRRDLYYRLKIIPITLPPLRDRAGDVELLVTHFIETYARESGKPIDGVETDAMRTLTEYHWPGNIRELRNLVERTILLGATGMLSRDDLPLDIREASGRRGSKTGFALPPHGVILEDLERDLVEQAIERCSGNQTQAAKLLGLNRDQIRYRIEKFGLRR